MKHALFYMPKDRSERIIANHNFYIEQATKRMLSQFDDIENEADKYGEAKLDEYGIRRAHKHDDNPSEAALQENIEREVMNALNEVIDYEKY